MKLTEKKSWNKTQLYFAIFIAVSVPAVLSVFYTGHGNSPASKSEIAQHVEGQYSVIGISKNNDAKFVVEVQISQKASDAQLKSIAEKVKEEIDANSEIGTVFFLLPEMVSGNGGWAAVDFTPMMQVRVIG